MVSEKEYRVNRRKKYPWVYTHRGIKQRCVKSDSPSCKRYGGRGIECRITVDELKFLWFRDKAYLLKSPSINRINNDGHYELSNCEYIERSLNVSLAQKGKCSRWKNHKKLKPEERAGYYEKRKTRLTWKEVEEIRAKYVPYEYSLRTLSREYGINMISIRDIILFKIYKNKPKF